MKREKDERRLTKLVSATGRGDSSAKAEIARRTEKSLLPSIRRVIRTRSADSRLEEFILKELKATVVSEASASYLNMTEFTKHVSNRLCQAIISIERVDFTNNSGIRDELLTTYRDPVLTVIENRR